MRAAHARPHSRNNHRAGRTACDCSPPLQFSTLGCVEKPIHTHTFTRLTLDTRTIREKRPAEKPQPSRHSWHRFPSGASDDRIETPGIACSYNRTLPTALYCMLSSFLCACRRHFAGARSGFLVRTTESACACFSTADCPRASDPFVWQRWPTVAVVA